MVFYSNSEIKNCDVKKYIIGQDNLFESVNNVDIKSLDDFFSQKSNGNLKNAKEIGSLLANYMISLNANQNNNYTIGNETDYQKNLSTSEKNKFSSRPSRLFHENKKILLWCASNAVLELLIKNEYSLSSAKSSFTKTLKFKDENFYKSVNNSVATSFFMLCKRSGNKINCYGDYFAFLCHRENNLKISRIGTIMYIIFFNLMQKKFIEISTKIKLEDI